MNCDAGRAIVLTVREVPAILIDVHIPMTSWERRGRRAARLRIAAALVSLFVSLGTVADEPPSAPKPASPAVDPKAIEFFENKVRPLLAERCLECHGPEKQKGNLRLDSLA